MRPVLGLLILSFIRKNALLLFVTNTHVYLEDYLLTGIGYKHEKAKLGMRKVRPWKWMAFTNPARKDNSVFYHWRRLADESKEYPFAQFNRVRKFFAYSEHQLLEQLKNFASIL